MHALTKQEASTGIDKNEIGLEVEQVTSKFIDLARQMESFFIQKRFLLSALKPELMLKEENLDLRYEINRKEELIKKHYERIELWKNMLSDQQQQQLHPPPPHPLHMPPSQMPGMPPIGHIGIPPSDLRPMPMGMPPRNAPGPMNMGGMTPAMQVKQYSSIERAMDEGNNFRLLLSFNAGPTTGSTYATATAYDASPTHAADASKLSSIRIDRNPRSRQQFRESAPLRRI